MPRTQNTEALTRAGQCSLFDAPAPPVRFVGDGPVAAGVIRQQQEIERKQRQSRDKRKSRIVTEAAVEQVEKNADPDWMNKALACVLTVALTHARFTSDDVWEAIHAAGVEAPREPSALGPVMRRASKEGWCKSSGENRASTRPSRHCCLLRVWVSKMRVEV